MSVEIPIRVSFDNCEESQQQFQLSGSEISEIYSPEAYLAIIPSYNELRNRPTINGVIVEGDKTSADYFIDQTYTYTQNTAAAEWHIIHNLNKRPSVTVVDSAGTIVIGEVRYLNLNEIKVFFTGAFSGKAYLN